MSDIRNRDSIKMPFYSKVSLIPQTLVKRSRTSLGDTATFFIDTYSGSDFVSGDKEIGSQTLHHLISSHLLDAAWRHLGKGEAFAESISRDLFTILVDIKEEEIRAKQEKGDASEKPLNKNEITLEECEQMKAFIKDPHQTLSDDVMEKLWSLYQWAPGNLAPGPDAPLRADDASHQHAESAQATSKKGKEKTGDGKIKESTLDKAAMKLVQEKGVDFDYEGATAIVEKFIKADPTADGAKTVFDLITRLANMPLQQGLHWFKTGTVYHASVSDLDHASLEAATLENARQKEARLKEAAEREKRKPKEVLDLQEPIGGLFGTDDTMGMGAEAFGAEDETDAMATEKTKSVSAADKEEKMISGTKKIEGEEEEQEKREKGNDVADGPAQNDHDSNAHDGESGDKIGEKSDINDLLAEDDMERKPTPAQFTEPVVEAVNDENDMAVKKEEDAAVADDSAQNDHGASAHDGDMGDKTGELSDFSKILEDEMGAKLADAQFTEPVAEAVNDENDMAAKKKEDAAVADDSAQDDHGASAHDGDMGDKTGELSDFSKILEDEMGTKSAAAQFTAPVSEAEKGEKEIPAMNKQAGL